MAAADAQAQLRSDLLACTSIDALLTLSSSQLHLFGLMEVRVTLA